MFSASQRVTTMSFLGRSQYPQQLPLNPHLANVGPTLLTRKEPLVKEFGGRFKVSSFRQVESQFEDQRRRRRIQLRIFFQGFHSLARRPVQQAESLVDPKIDGDVGGITGQSVRNSGRA